MVDATWWTHYAGSGTVSISQGRTDEAWLIVHYPGDDLNVRASMASQLATYLNGGDRPLWLADMRRYGDSTLIDVDGSAIHATGPMYDSDPPHLCWRQRDDDEARDARARLIDLLC